MADPRVLVGPNTVDDAAVYRLSDDLAVVATVDYITPVVDDPYDWGRIAAANALSDVYAMGAQPLFALNTVNFPRDRLPLDVLERVLDGGAAQATQAGIGILGGHSIDDPEPKYGMVVVGAVHPDRVIHNRGARPGDALVLTKPLGIGIITTAIKQGQASEETRSSAVEVMATLNRAAAEAMVASGAIHAATDVTGFGLLGHLTEMLGAGAIGAEIDVAAVPVLASAWDLVARDIVPGGSQRNLEAVQSRLDVGGSVPRMAPMVLADAQTSGGLLIAVAPAAADDLLGALDAAGVRWATRIGRFTEESGCIRLI